MAHRVAPRAEAYLDDIWLYVAKESASMDVATRLIDSITGRFSFWPPFRTSDAPAMKISEPERMARFKCPASVDFMETLPKGRYGEGAEDRAAGAVWPE
jgi:hypothetical protein